MPKIVTQESLVKDLKVKNASIVVLGQYINDKTKILVRCKECGNEWYATPSSLKQGHGCPKCATKKNADKARIDSKVFLQWIKNNLPDVELLTDYEGVKENITCRYKICGNIWTTKADNLKAKKSCPNCARIKINNLKIKTNEEFLIKLNSVNPDTKPLESYKGSHTKIKVQCCKCGTIWETTPHNLCSGFSCLICKSSKGEKIIKNFLVNNHIQYIPQYRFKDCKDKKQLPFDFYLPDKNMCIEYDDEQHYNPITFGGITLQEAKAQLQQTQQRDNLKTQYCKNNNIKLLSISYLNLSSIESILQKILSYKYNTKVQ